jgi:hypothetical protein
MPAHCEHEPILPLCTGVGCDSDQGLPLGDVHLGILRARPWVGGKDSLVCLLAED